MQLNFQYNDELITLDVEADGDGWRVTLPGGSTHRIAATRRPNDILRIVDGARAFDVPFARTSRGSLSQASAPSRTGAVEIAFAGSAYAFTPAAAARPGAAAWKAPGTLAAPMGGVVADVVVSEGQTVDAYAPLVVVEAMKVYATIEAPFAGTVKSISVKKGDRVELGQQLVDIERAGVDG